MKQTTNTSEPVMSKEEALKALENGHKLTHIYFYKSQWICKSSVDTTYQTEEGLVSSYWFWKSRDGENWKTGWSLWKEPDPVNYKSEIDNIDDDTFDPVSAEPVNEQAALDWWMSLNEAAINDNLKLARRKGYKTDFGLSNEVIVKMYADTHLSTPEPLSSSEDLFTGGDWMKGGQMVNEPYEAGIWGNNAFKVATVFGRTQQEAEANAALIAESKNMYYAIKLLNEKLKNNCKWTSDDLEMYRTGIEAMLNRIKTMDKQEGWAMDVTNYRAKQHYYKDGVSLCGIAKVKHFFKQFEKDKMASKYSCDCVKCINKLKTLNHGK